MTNINMIQTDEHKIFYARTIADHRQQVLWFSKGKTRGEIFDLMKNPIWRSRLVDFRGKLFCEDCDQIISLHHCPNCGQTVGILPTQYNLIMPSDTRKYLEAMAQRLLRTVEPEDVLEILHALNLRRARNRLDAMEVELLFTDCGNAELKRRRGA